MNNIIINADDFGKSKEINFAIMELMESNLCMDTTLLVNFQDSAHAADLARSRNKQNQVGIHFNLTEGYPLTTRIKSERLFCNEEGLFHYKKEKRIIRLTNSEKRAVYEELSAQVQQCKRLGIPISHADSHNHIHEEPGLLFIFFNIVKKEKIPFLRLTNNLGKTSMINEYYRKSYNYLLSLNKLAGTKYFGSIMNLTNNRIQIDPNSNIELMVHPGQIHDKAIYDVYSKENLSLILPRIINGKHLISYNQLKK